MCFSVSNNAFNGTDIVYVKGKRQKNISQGNKDWILD